ncbi:MAG: YqgE/AlgH family protein [Candidatus Puniceispirillaceae bacterium]
MMIAKNVEILNSIRGQLLVAMPHIDDARFKKSVILMCQHDSDAAMGLVINKAKPNFNLDDLREKLSLKKAHMQGETLIYDGGPVENGRGFVVHSADQMLPNSLPLGPDMGMSVQLSMINEIASGMGPMHHRIMLGYAGWDAGQLESELKDGMWFHMTASSDFIFNTDPDQLWNHCFALSGFDAASLSPHAGSA